MMESSVEEKIDRSIEQMMAKGFNREEATRILLISVSKEYIKLYEEVNSND